MNLRVPLQTGSPAPANGIDDTGIAMGSPFKMWFEVKVTTTDAAGSYFHIWPGTIATHSAALTVPDPGTWNAARVGSGPEDATCSAGVWIDSTHFGTTNPGGSNLIEWTVPPAAPFENTFFAAPMNQTGATIQADQLHAKFRLAEWGSQPDWNDVPDPTQLWTAILPGLDDVQGPPLTPVPDGTNANLTKGWTMTAATQPAITDFTSGARRPHQCMLVELSGAGFDFGRQSCYRNMDVGPASEFVREAQISVKGLDPIGASTHRNVYLFVQALNMPATVEPAPAGSTSGGQPTSTVGAAAGAVPRSYYVQGNAKDGGELPSGWEIAHTVPTHMVHVFRDSGEVYEEDDGSHRPVLQPQTSFGVFIEHSGPLYGWDHTLEGNLEQLAPNFYRVRVPNGGAVKVTQRVTALEQPRKKGCLPWLLALFAALVAVIKKLFK